MSEPMTDERQAELLKRYQGAIPSSTSVIQGHVREMLAEIERLRAREAEERGIVDGVWAALDIQTYEQAGGKSCVELIANMRARAVQLRAALETVCLMVMNLSRSAKPEEWTPKNYSAQDCINVRDALQQVEHLRKEKNQSSRGEGGER